MAYILTSDGLGKNSMQYELGRGGYFPSGSGTSETQLILIKGACEAYRATGITTYLDNAKKYAASYIKYYCFETEAPESGTWPSHWISNAGAAFPVKGPVAANPNNSGNILSTVAFVSGLATLTDLANVYLVATTGSVASWNCVLAGISSGTVKTFEYYYDKDGMKFDSSGNYLNVTSIANAGQVKLSGTYVSFTGNALVSYSQYEATEIAYGSNFECWPMFRVLESGAWNCAADSVHWAIDAFQSLVEVDSTQTVRWTNSRDAMIRNWDAVTTVSTDLYAAKKEIGKPYDAWPLTYFAVTVGGVEYYSPTAHVTASRDASGYARFVLPTDATRSKFSWKNDTLFVTTNTTSTNYKVKIYLGNVGAAAGRLYIYDDNGYAYQTRWAYAANSLVTNSIEVPFNYFNPSYSWGTATNPSWDEGSGIQYHFGIPTTSDGVGFGGYWAVASLPSVTYNLSTGSIKIRTTDSSGATALSALLTVGSHSITPTAPGTLPITNIDFVTTDATVGAIVVNTPTGVHNLPATLNIRKFWIVLEETTPLDGNTILIGDVIFEDIGSGGLLSRDAITYNTGALPFQLSNNSPRGGSGLGTASNFQGPYYTGYQNPTPYYIKHVLGDATALGKAEIMMNLLIDSQTAYNASTGVTGPYAPVYLVKAWDSAIFGPVNTFSWLGPDPNTFWGGFQYRAFSSVADFWQRSNRYGISDASVTKAGSSTLSFLTWLDTWLTNNPAELSVPSAFNVAVSPSVPYGDPCMIAVAMKGALFLKKGGNTTAINMRVITKLYAMLIRYNVTSGDMDGSFTADPTNGVFYGYWAGEIMEALALYAQLM